MYNMQQYLTLLKNESSFFVVVGLYSPKSGKFFDCLFEKSKKNNFTAKLSITCVRSIAMLVHQAHSKKLKNTSSETF